MTSNYGVFLQLTDYQILTVFVEIRHRSESINDEAFDPKQPFSLWIAIQIITSILDLCSDILYVSTQWFYSPYLHIAGWIFIFFQLIPDWFVFLQIMADQGDIRWYPVRRKWSGHSNVLECSLFVIIHSVVSTLMFAVTTSVLMLLKLIPIESVRRYFVDEHFCSIMAIDHVENEDEQYDEKYGMGLTVDLRLHSIFLLFEVFFESLPLSAIICINSLILLDSMSWIAWLSLGVSGYVVLRNIYMFVDDICFSRRSQRKLYYCLWSLCIPSALCLSLLWNKKLL